MKTKFPVLLLAVVTAVMIWLYDVTVVDPNDTSTFTGIAVSFENEDAMHSKGLMVTDGDNGAVTLRISGRRSELKKLSKNNIEITVDLNQIDSAGTHELPYTVRYPANVSSGDLSIDNRTPAYVSVSVEHYIRKAVEVRIVFEGDTEADGGSLIIDTDAMEIMPDAVAVTGPAALVDSIEYARVIINKSDIHQTTLAEYPFDLLNAAGEIVPLDELVTDCEQLTVSIPVLKYKEVPLKLKTVPGGGATEDNITYTLSVEHIKISGEAAVIDGIEQIELGTLDFAAVVGPTTRTYPVILPEGVANVSGVAEIEVNARVSGLNVETMAISEFELTNVPDGMVAEPMSESVQLTLRGTPAALESLQQEDVRVKVDLSGFTQAGTFIVPVIVEVPEGLQVGAIGSNTLAVTLS